MRRGEIWTGADGADYANKPRPVVIIQTDAIDATDSITVCAVTTTFTQSPLIRIAVLPDDENGLREASWVMVDKILTMPRTRLGYRIGRLDKAKMALLDEGIITFLGLGTPVQPLFDQAAPLPRE